MRFAIVILCVLALASGVGTVLPQNQPLAVYIGQFGPFWAAVFEAAGLFQIYASPGFVTLMVFLVLSTSLCLLRHTPRLWRDVRRWRGQMHVSALRALPHHHEPAGRLEPGQTLEQAVGGWARRLGALGWRCRVQAGAEGALWLSARKGRYGRLGYVAAHGAVVLIALGGLLDGDALLRLRMAWLGVTPYSGQGLIAAIPPGHRLGADTPAFRASLYVPEGASTGQALIVRPGGAVVQELPFQIELRRFHAEYWPNGTPRQFGSEVIVHSADGRSQPATLSVNAPLQVQGVTVYQSSFEDGGSRVGLMAWPLAPAALSGSTPGALGLRLAGVVGGPPLSVPLPAAAWPRTLAQPPRLELSDYRAVTVSPKTRDETPGAGWHRLLTPARIQASGTAQDTARTQLGPRLMYRWRDAAGQAREFDTLFEPQREQGVPVQVFGARDPRDADGAPLRTLRIPVDAQGVRGWLRIVQALYDPLQRERAATQAAQGVPPQERAAWRASARRALDLFAGALAVPLTPALAADRAAAGLGAERPLGGDAAVQAALLAAAAQPPERSALLLRVLDSSLRALVDQVRAEAGQLPLQRLPQAEAYWRLLRASLSDQFFYPAPALIQAVSVQPVQASVFEVARAPGRWLVYPGAALLALGVLALLMGRDRRLWLRVQPAGPGAEFCGILALAGPRPDPALAQESLALYRHLFPDRAHRPASDRISA